MKKGKLVLIGGISAAVVIAALAGTVLYLLADRGSSKEEETSRGIVVNENNVEDILDELASKEAEKANSPVEIPKSYTVQMTNVWHFKTGDSETYDAYIANNEVNTTPVYFDLFLEEDESTAIYRSPVIPLGAELEKFKLDKPLAAGTYNCVMIYHLIDDDQNTLTELRVGVTVVIEQ